MSAANSNSNFSVDSQAKVSVDQLNEEQNCPQHDWSDRAYKLRHKTREFCKKIEQLEQKLAEATEKSQSLQKRAENAEILIARQSEEIGNSQNRFNQVIQELEATRQESQHKQTSIERLCAKLEVSQEQIARIERECAVLQETYHEQQYKLLETEQQARELNVRLYRQQRYTLQYKTALERQAESSSSSSEMAKELESITFEANQQPIQAWSNSSDRLNYIPDLNLQTTAKLEPIEKNDLTTQQPVDLHTKKLPFNQDDRTYLPIQKVSVEDEKTRLTTQKQNVSSSNSPSPLIANSSSNKKPKSLAAIELPTFPRYRAY
jgi:chromosome segregation ATPase